LHEEKGVIDRLNNWKILNVRSRDRYPKKTLLAGLITDTLEKASCENKDEWEEWITLFDTSLTFKVFTWHSI